jgi:predicted Rossmann fold nucleotide-binding protein DprA/Smf involved in DNA uptake
VGVKRIAVIGSRSWTDSEAIAKALSAISRPWELVSGGAEGADTLAELWCKQAGMEERHRHIIRPNYKRYGRYRAPAIRNREIVRMADRLIAFWDGESGGTAMTIGFAREKGIPVEVIGV